MSAGGRGLVSTLRSTRGLIPVVSNIFGPVRLGASGGFTTAMGSVRATAFGAGKAAAGGGVALAAGALIPSLPGGQTKSSARPGGAGTGSPLTRTRSAVASVRSLPASVAQFPSVVRCGYGTAA